MKLVDPLVSIIVTNFNYAAFLEECVESVFQQTYQRIECILVDDLSTDNSGEIITELCEKYQIKVCRRQVNGGQSAAILSGLSLATGLYVVLLDADDVLLPQAIATHVEVHRNAPVAVGFTCCDMFQVAGEQLFWSRAPDFGRLFTESRDRRVLRRRLQPNPFDPLAQGMPQKPGADDILDHCYLVDPADRGYVWAATSAFMFRRDALAIWQDTPALEELRLASDTFFAFGINAICGSILIDIPLVYYRIHGKNGYSHGLPLNNVRQAGARPSDGSLQAVRLLVAEARRRKAEFQSLFWTPQRYDAFLSILERNVSDLDYAFTVSQDLPPAHFDRPSGLQEALRALIQFWRPH